MLGRRIENKYKTLMARKYLAQRQIYDVEELRLRKSTKNLKDKESNILLVFDKYLLKKT